MNISFERSKTGILAIAAAGIFAAGAVAERANRLYSTPSPADPAAEETTVTMTADSPPAAPRSGKSHRP